MTKDLGSAPVAVVVGGASGIGAAVAARLRADGYAVTVADRTPGPGVVTVDVTDEAGVEALLAGVVERHGRLDAVVNAAGISTFGAVVDHDAAETALDRADGQVVGPDRAVRQLVRAD